MSIHDDQVEAAILREKLAQVDSRLRRHIEAANAAGRPQSNADRAQLANAQARADAVAQHFGQQAPAPITGESLLNYRKRLLAPYRDYSPNWTDADAEEIEDPRTREQVFAIMENTVYADAVKFAESSASVPQHQLREIKKLDQSGRHISTFVGDPAAWMELLQDANSAGPAMDDPGNAAAGSGATDCRERMMDSAKLDLAAAYLDRLSSRLDRCERWLDRDDARRDAELEELPDEPVQSEVAP